MRVFSQMNDDELTEAALEAREAYQAASDRFAERPTSDRWYDCDLKLRRAVAAESALRRRQLTTA